MIGLSFNSWAVLQVGSRNKHGELTYLCRCACGATRSVRMSALKNGHSKSCGSCGTSKTKHRILYVIWLQMRYRTENPEHPSYPDYGARGIRVCGRWKISFDNFLADMGPKPPGLSIERKNNSEGYSPENCYWGTSTDQNNNKRNNARLTAFGRTQTTSQWSKEAGIKRTTLVGRLRRGWTVEKALSLPR